MTYTGNRTLISTTPLFQAKIKKVSTPNPIPAKQKRGDRGKNSQHHNHHRQNKKSGPGRERPTRGLNVRWPLHTPLHLLHHHGPRSTHLHLVMESGSTVQYFLQSVSMCVKYVDRVLGKVRRVMIVTHVPPEDVSAIHNV